MRNHSGLFLVFILILIALIMGISAADLWGYILDFTKIAFKYICEWIQTAIYAIRDALTSGVSQNKVPTTTAQTYSAILHLF